MYGTVVELRAAVTDAASAFDADALDRAGAMRAVRLWSAVRHAAAAAEAIAAARVAACGTPAGAADAAAWLADVTGTTSARAREVIRTGAALGSQPTTRAKATAGGLSFDQTAAITAAVTADPAAEVRLVDEAATGSLSELRDHCARVRAAADPDPVATEQRLHARRALHRYRDGEGAEHLHMVGTKLDLAKVDQALAPIIDQLFDERRHHGPREPYDAYAFDALVRLAEHGGAAASITDRAGRPKLRYLALLRVDLEALTRGTVTNDDELCELAGLGPIPIATARELLGESVLKLVLTKGVDVLNVTHLGRGPTTAQQIALLWQQPTCTRQGCGRRRRLETDHRDDWTRVRCTELANLDPLCEHDHDLKTHHGWALTTGTGTRPMVPPDHPDHPRHAKERSP